MEDSPVKSLKLRMAKDRCYMLLLVFKGIFWKTLLGNLTKSSELGLFAALIFCSLWRRPVALIILHGAEEFKAKKNQTTCKLQGSSWQSKAFVTSCRTSGVRKIAQFAPPPGTSTMFLPQHGKVHVFHCCAKHVLRMSQGRWRWTPYHLNMGFDHQDTTF